MLRVGRVTPENLQAEQRRLEAELDKLAAAEQSDEQAMRAFAADVLKASELLKSLTELYEKANLHEKARLAKILISELEVSENTAQIKPQISMEPLFSDFVLKCEGKGWFSELIPHKELIESPLDLMQTRTKKI